jgi:hypothetical protein
VISKHQPIRIVGCPCVVQGSHSPCSRLGCDRLCPTGISAQLSPLASPTRHDGTHTRNRVSSFNPASPRRCRPLCWVDKVNINLLSLFCASHLTYLLIIQHRNCHAHRTPQRFSQPRCISKHEIYTFLVKLQLQSQKSASDRQFKGPVDCARQIIRTQGLTGMWSGLTGSLAFRCNFFWMFLSFEVHAAWTI